MYALLAAVPILVTVVYEDEKLTTVTAILSILLIYISGCFVVYDLDKVVDYLYVLNMLVLLVAIFILWIISCYMIQFNEKKRKIIIQGDIERFDLQKRIYIDGLTLIGNKSAFDRHLDLIFDDEHNTYHLAMFDIDLFKNFNDQYGHLFGDRVLTCLGEILLMDMSDMQSYRYGGDEFCLIFKNMADSEVIDKIKTIQKRLKESIIMDKNVEITISVGVSKKDFELSKTEWINRADKALYKSKNTGRNKITFFRDV